MNTHVRSDQTQPCLKYVHIDEKNPKMVMNDYWDERLSRSSQFFRNCGMEFRSCVTIEL